MIAPYRPAGRRWEDRPVTYPLPPEMIARARDFHGTPAPARPAATVVLLRTPFEVYVLRRATTMVFGGVYAFPGGGVDPSDRPVTVRPNWGDRLGLPDADARAGVGAAARELFEEAGVLLAGTEEATLGDISAPDWEADRAALARRELTMTELLDRRGLRLRDDLLFPWSRWITPEFEPKRFDTWFFVALLPDGQTARDVSGEADRTAWISPHDTGDLAMLPPTRFTLDDLAVHDSLPAVVAAAEKRNAAAPVTPRVEMTEDGGAVLRISRNDR